MWHWEAFQDEAGLNDLTLTDPEKYTLTLLSDGTASIQADCNQVTWTYALDGDAQDTSGSLTFDSTGPSTSAFCGDESLDVQYLTWLGETVAFVVSGEELFLNLRFDSGNMIFGPAVVQPEQETGSNQSGELSPDFIQLDLQGLAQSYEWEVIPGTSISTGPGGQGFPDHIVLEFDGESTLELPYSEWRILYLFPTQATIDLYNASGIDSVSQQVERLQELIVQADNRQETPDGTMPLLPPPGSLMDRWVQFSDLNFTHGQGVRYVSDSPFRQSIGVWTNETTDYYYQGLTEDGRYYISFKWPVSTALLPNTLSDASEELTQRASSSRESYDQYESSLKTDLNALTSAEWSPDLSRLDALIASLAFLNE
jgi:heat shock protein HslJ